MSRDAELEDLKANKFDSPDIELFLEAINNSIYSYNNDLYIRQEKHLKDILDYCKLLLKEVGE